MCVTHAVWVMVMFGRGDIFGWCYMYVFREKRMISAKIYNLTEKCNVDIATSNLTPYFYLQTSYMLGNQSTKKYMLKTASWF